MAIEKQIGTRIQLKIDTTANWGQATNFIPKKGEPIIYKDPDSSIAKIKIGDGSTLVGNLPFVNEQTQQQASGIVASETSAGNVVIANASSVYANAENSSF